MGRGGNVEAALPVAVNQRPTVYVSFAPSDQSLVDELLRQLAVAEANGAVTVLHKGHVSPSEDVTFATHSLISRSDTILMLVSSDYQTRQLDEIREIFGQQRARGVRLVPVLLRSTQLLSELENLALLPGGGAPISTLPSSDAAWKQIIDAVLGARATSSQSAAFHKIERISNVTAQDAASVGAATVAGLSDLRLERVYIERTIEQEIVADLLKAAADPPFLLIVGDAGNGKTSLLWSIYRRIGRSTEHVPWLMKATAFLHNSLDAGTIARAAVDVVTSGRSPVLLVDTVDLLLHTEEQRSKALDLIDVVRRAGCAVLAACRPREAKQLKALQSRDPYFLQVYDVEELPRAIHAYASHLSAQGSTTAEEQEKTVLEAIAAGRSVREVCERPLTLRMLFMVYAPKPVQLEINVFRLYTEFWNARVCEDRRAGSDFVLDETDLSVHLGRLALWMVARGILDPLEESVVAFMAAGSKPDLSPRRAIELLVNRGVLVRQEGGRIELFHQTFFEHAAAKGLLQELGAEGLQIVYERVAEVTNDLFLSPVLEQTLLLAERGALGGLRGKVITILRELLHSTDVVTREAAVYAYVHFEEEAAELAPDVLAALENHVVAVRLADILPNLSERRAQELAVFLDAVWKNDWTVKEHVLDQLPRLAQRSAADATRIRQFLDRNRVLDFVLGQTKGEPGDRKLLRVLMSLAVHGVSSWADVVNLYGRSLPRTASRELQVHIVTTLIEHAAQLGPTELAGRFEDAVAAFGSDVGKNAKPLNEAWGRLWAIAWSAKSCNFRRVLDELAGASGDYRVRRRFSGVPIFLAKRPAADVAEAWRAFLDEDDTGRSWLWVEAVWKPMVGLTLERSPAAETLTNNALEILVPPPAAVDGVDKRKHALEIVKEAGLSGPTAEGFFSRPEIATPARWVLSTDLGPLLSAALISRIPIAFQAVDMLLSSQDGDARRLLGALVVRLRSEPLDQRQDLVDVLVRVSISLDDVGGLLLAIGRFSSETANLLLPYRSSLSDFLERKMFSPRALERRDAPRLWLELIGLGLADAPSQAFIASALEREKDEVAKGWLAALAAHVPGADTEAALALLFDIAKVERQHVREHAFKSYVALARRVPNNQGRVAQALALALSPQVHSGRFSTLGWLLSDVVMLDAERGTELLEHMVFSSEAANLGNAARRDVRNLLRMPTRQWARVASQEQLGRVLREVYRLPFDLACLLIDAGCSERLADALPVLDEVYRHGDVSEETKKYIHAQRATRARSEGGGRWPALCVRLGL